jgi:peptidoglycan/xylan/chitin deacetylase (PgdA/CDA1 family)
MRIPITMCHGINPRHRLPLTAEHLDSLIRIAHELGFESINYDDLAAWRAGPGQHLGSGRPLPPRPIMFDLDHPVKSMRYEVLDTLDRYGFKANLFIDTGRIEAMLAGPRPPEEERAVMTWEEVGDLVRAGWHIGAHTVTHPNLSQLSVDEPSGARIRQELEECDATLERRLGIRPRDFAFTGTSWSHQAEQAVMQRYRFGRLWIVGAEYQVDGRAMRYADLVGVPGADEADGGPPQAARYITRQSNPYRLPSMEIQALLYQPAAFRTYLQGALEDPPLAP